MDLKFRFGPGLLLQASALVAALLLPVSCIRESFPLFPEDGREVSFVASVDPLETKSGEAIRNEAVPLETQGICDRMYLIPFDSVIEPRTDIVREPDYPAMMVDPRTHRSLLTGERVDVRELSSKASERTSAGAAFTVYAYSHPGHWGGSSPSYLGGLEMGQISGSTYGRTDSFTVPQNGYYMSYFALCAPVSMLSATVCNATQLSSGLRVELQPNTNIDLQEDVLEGYTLSTRSAHVPMNFTHSLTEVDFQINDIPFDAVLKEITIYGVYGYGMHTVGSYGWYSQSSLTSYALSDSYSKPLGGGLLLAEGASWSLSGSVSGSYFLIPQTCPSGAQVRIRMEVNGSDVTFTGSIGGQVWQQGFKVTYVISFTDYAQILTVSTPAHFTAAGAETLSPLCTVTSYVNYASGNTAALPWVTEFSYDGGETWTDRLPYWLDSITMSGSGGTSAQNVVATSKARADQMFNGWGTWLSYQGSSQHYVDLSLCSAFIDQGNGEVLPRETANSYVIHGPGKFKIPLFYGNSVVDGSAFPDAYTRIVSNANTGPFVNAYGAVISDGDIYRDLVINGNTNGASVSDLGSGVLLWCTLDNVITVEPELEIGPDGVRYLRFEVNPETIENSMGVIGVLKSGSSNEFVWSWNLQITRSQMLTYQPKTSDQGKTFYYPQAQFMQGGGCVGKRDNHVMVRFSNGSASQVVTIDQDYIGNIYSQGQFGVYFQFGRKDAFFPPITHLYTSGYDLWKYDSGARSGGDYRMPLYGLINSLTVTPMSDNSIASAISFPYRLSTNFWQTTTAGGPTDIYCNIWNYGASTYGTSDYSDAMHKTVYDPCPQGFGVGPVLNGMDVYAENANGHNGTLWAFSTSTTIMGAHGSLLGLDLQDDNGVQLSWTKYGGFDPASFNYIGTGGICRQWENTVDDTNAAQLFWFEIDTPQLSAIGYGSSTGTRANDHRYLRNIACPVVACMWEDSGRYPH